MQQQNAPAPQLRLAFATLPLGPDELRQLAEGQWSVVDQATRTPGLLIIQGPALAEQASGDAQEVPDEAGAAPPSPNGHPVAPSATTREGRAGTAGV